MAKIDFNAAMKRARATAFEEEEEEESEEEEPEAPQDSFKVEDVSTGARFGRPAVVDVIMMKSRKARIQAAKEQIAGICQEIVSDPENSVRSISLPPLVRVAHKYLVSARFT